MDGATKWIVLKHQASSLFNVIAAGGFTSTAIRRETWISLINATFFQENCNREGLNVQQSSSVFDNHVKVRIGIVANNQNDCKSCDSCMGFGISVRSCEGYDVSSTSCGAGKAGCYGNRNQNIAAFGYILVQ